jgi:hypothetical protein
VARRRLARPPVPALAATAGRSAGGHIRSPIGPVHGTPAVTRPAGELRGRTTPAQGRNRRDPGDQVRHRLSAHWRSLHDGTHPQLPMSVWLILATRTHGRSGGYPGLDTCAPNSTVQALDCGIQSMPRSRSVGAAPAGARRPLIFVNVGPVPDRAAGPGSRRGDRGRRAAPRFRSPRSLSAGGSQLALRVVPTISMNCVGRRPGFDLFMSATIAHR